MTYLFNVLYLLLLVLLSPWLLYRALRRGRYRRGLAAKLLGRVSHPLLASGGRKPRVEDAPLGLSRREQEASAPRSPCVWFHGVSVGEVHLLRQVVALARE